MAQIQRRRSAQQRAQILEDMKALTGEGLRNPETLKKGVGEIRVDYGPGYRLYSTRRGAVVILFGDSPAVRWR